MQLEHKIAIVTGGSRGIGFAIAQRFSQEGATVVIASKNAAFGQAAVKNINHAVFIETDVSRQNQVNDLVDQTLEKFGGIDILVNNAAAHEADTFENESPEIWMKMFEVNIMGTVFQSQAVVKQMKQQSRGKIIHIASKAGVVGEPGHAAYSASKGAIIALTRAMAIELAPYHINVNAICPGPVLTDMLCSVIPEVRKREDLALEAPLGRLGKPEDIAGASMLLASDESDWITGQTINIDGGFSILK